MNFFANFLLLAILPLSVLSFSLPRSLFNLCIEMAGMRRLSKELESFQKEPPEGCVLESNPNPQEWVVTLHGAPATIYAGEVFHLRFRFSASYPFDSPEVVFVGAPPVHPHIYSNGHICLSILYDNWSPALTVRSVCLSILSMLSRFSSLLE